MSDPRVPAKFRETRAASGSVMAANTTNGCPTCGLEQYIKHPLGALWVCGACFQEARGRSEREAEKTWDETVAETIAAGGTVVAPNGLPVRCIRADGTMLEDEHGDHIDYQFPVTATHPLAEYPETHALIYTDGVVALTLYECCHSLFLIPSGKCSLSDLSDGFTLTPESVAKIEALFAKRIAAKPADSDADGMGGE